MIRHLRLNEMDLQRCKQMLTFLERHSDQPLCIFGNGRTTALGLVGPDGIIGVHEIHRLGEVRCQPDYGQTLRQTTVDALDAARRALVVANPNACDRW
jgi:hypothetical protein